MDSLERITSNTNAKIKLAAKLHTAKYRKEENLFVAEGIRLSEMAVAARWPIEFGLISDGAIANPRAVAVVERLQERQVPVYQVSQELYQKAADTVNPQGLMLVMGQRIFTWQEVLKCPRGNAPLIVVLDGVQDPGNAGTIIRTADALGCSGVVCMEGTTDLFADKTVRASMGSVFNLPIIDHVTPKGLIASCFDNEVSLVATALDDQALHHYVADYNSAVAIILGNEGNGVSPELQAAADKKIYIPMCGKAESLNVASAAAIILYEAYRQRAIL